MSLRSSISLQLAKSISTSSSSTSSTSLLPTVIQRSFSSKTSRNSPRSTSDLSDPTSTPQLTPLKTSNPKELANYFSKSLHPKIELPNNVALQAITHESWEMGNSLTGNNRRLSFIGKLHKGYFSSFSKEGHTTEWDLSCCSEGRAGDWEMFSSENEDSLGFPKFGIEERRWSNQRGHLDLGRLRLFHFRVGKLMHALLSASVESEALVPAKTSLLL